MKLTECIDFYRKGNQRHIERNEKSMFYVRRYCTVDTFDFLNLDTQPCHIKVDAYGMGFTPNRGGR